MADKVTFAPISTFTNDTTATTQTNANYTLMQTALDNTLSRDGTSPNQMNSAIDMNSNRIVNLPAPGTPQEPLRVVDLQGGGSFTFNALPVGGSTGQVLEKNSNTNYDAGWKNLPASTAVVSPQTFGAFGDGNSHPISGTDVTNNPQWIGQYKAGVEWDSVGIQEAIYHCFATSSTPGNVVYNTANSNPNLKFFCPEGNYQINIMIQMAASGFEMAWDGGRHSSQWNWVGGTVISGNTHSNTTIDGITPAALNVYNYNRNTGGRIFIQGAGILPGTFCSSFDFVNGKITLSQAATSTTSGTNLYLWSPMFYCDSASYGVFRGPTFSATNTLPRAASFDTTNAANVSTVDYNPSSAAMWVLDATASGHGNLTQQLSIYDPIIFGNNAVDVGLSISPAGGGAEGATIQIFNPSFNGCNTAAIQSGGSNALSNVIWGGDFIGNYLYGVQCMSGSFSAYNSTLENQLNNLFFAPQFCQPTNICGDYMAGSGAGFGNPCVVCGVRSEGSVLVQGQNGSNLNVYDSSILTTDFSDWFASFPFQLGAPIVPSTNNAKKRAFVCVDTGGLNHWDHMVPASNVSTITDAGSPGYTVNQWNGFTFHFRFGSNGFVSHLTNGITANTANTVTTGSTTWSPATNSLYTITGKTGAAAPNWDTAAAGNLIDIGFAGSSSGVTGVAGSSTITSATLFTVNQYVIVPCGDTLGDPIYLSPGNTTALPPIVCPYIAKILSVTPGSPNSYGMSKPVGRTFTNSNAYWGTPIVDNQLSWLHLDYNEFYGITKVDTFQGGHGKVSHVIGGVSNYNSALPMTTVFRSFDSGGTSLTNQNVLGGAHYYVPNLTGSVSGTLDLTPLIGAGDYVFLSLSGNATLNAPLPSPNMTQRFTLLIQGGGNNTITFGTNFQGGTNPANTSTAGYIIITFVNGGLNGGALWVEEGRYPTNLLQLDTGTKTATATTGAATLNKNSGVITSESLTTAAGVDYVLTLTNSNITTGSQVFASTALGTSTTGEPCITSIKPGTGSVVINVRNIHASAAFNGTITITYMVLTP